MNCVYCRNRKRPALAVAMCGDHPVVRTHHLVHTVPLLRQVRADFRAQRARFGTRDTDWQAAIGTANSRRSNERGLA